MNRPSRSTDSSTKHALSSTASLPSANPERKNLARAGGAFVLLMAITLLTLFTPIFDGTVGGVGIAYIVGTVDFIVVLGVAALHCVESNRAARTGDQR